MSLSYYKPRTFLDLLSDLPTMTNYSFLAGGTDLVVQWKEKKIDPHVIIELKDLMELKGIRHEDDFIEIGAMVTHEELENDMLIKQYAYSLAEAASKVGSPQIRNIGTIGGNICNGSPAADTVPVLLVLDGKLILESKQGKAQIDLADFFIGPGKTVLEKGTILTKVRITKIKENEGAVFIKNGKRKALAISVVNGAVWVKLDGQKIIDVRIALGSVAPKPTRLFELEKWLVGHNASEEVFLEAAKRVRDIIKPITDIRSTEDYRMSISEYIIYHGLKNAAEKARGSC